MRAAVDDHQPLRRSREGLDQLVVGTIAEALQTNALQLLVQAKGFGRELALRPQGQSPLELRRGDGRLRRGAQHDRASVIARELVERREARAKDRQRDRLRLVEHDHGLGEIMQPPAARRAIGVQALEQLDVGRHDDGRGPVLHRETQLVARLPARDVRLVDGRVVLENDFLAENLAKNGGRLVDDRGERDRIDDPLEIVLLRMLQGEARAKRASCRRRSGPSA